MIDNKLFQKPTAAELTKMRIQARRKRRLTYDCINVVVKGDSVVCKKRHTFKPVGRRHGKGLALLTILKGRSSSVCQKCEDYDGEENE